MEPVRQARGLVEVAGATALAMAPSRASFLVLAVVLLGRTGYPYFTRWLDHRERMHELRKPRRRTQHH
jgi:hypothetical protein